MKTDRKILIFGGTSEGRSLSECLSRHQIAHTVMVATDYGEEVMAPSEFCKVHQGRLNAEQMAQWMKDGAFDVVVDATHPYAVEVSKNIRQAAQKIGVRYLRELRQNGGGSRPDAAKDIVVDSAAQAADYLETQSGTIFLTTGSKELRVFAERISDKSRLTARVLPSAKVIESCRELGLEGKQILAMQGPFSEEMNLAMLRQTKAAFLVTKDTGVTGGYPEKESAARRLGIPMVILRKPEESGMSRAEILAALVELTGFDLSDETEAAKADSGSESVPESVPESVSDSVLDSVSGTVPGSGKNDLQESRSITCIGIGMGDPGTLTHAAADAIREADILFGAKRILESVLAMKLAASSCAAEEEYSGKKIAQYLSAHPDYRKIVILMSGDVGFYSGARGVQEAFPDEKVSFLCGISSVVYFASRIPTSWQDAKLISAHGKQVNLLNYVQKYPKLISIVSGVEDVRKICQELHESGMDQVRVTVGNNLSYPDESVRTGFPADFLDADTTGLHIMMVENPAADHILTPGIPDEEFVRGKVPMTKEEIRILSAAKLRLREDSVVYDIGAGTGSVSVECARLCTQGTVYAIERNPEGIDLICENARKMHLSNLIAVEGIAPDALADLPVPTHAFIGGSAGNMKQIIELLIEKNPDIRIVINTIALESIAEVMNILKEKQFEDVDIVQISAARSRTLGRYHMMTGQNPVYIVTIQASEKDKD